MNHSSIPKILFEDANLIVLSKPAGMLSQGGRKGEPNLVDWLRGYLGRYYVGLVHRLDRNVSGVMVVAKRSKAAARLTQALQEGQLVRIYRGWVKGRLKTPERWEHRVLKDEKKNQTRVVRQPQKNAKQAVLTVSPIAYGKWQQADVTLAEFCLETGRSHQIRVQSAFEGYPLLGDRKYVQSVSSKSPTFLRPALHSYSVKFPHPISGRELTFESDLPEDMKQIRVTAMK